MVCSITPMAVKQLYWEPRPSNFLGSFLWGKLIAAQITWLEPISHLLFVGDLLSHYFQNWPILLPICNLFFFHFPVGYSVGEGWLTYRGGKGHLSVPNWLSFWLAGNATFKYQIYHISSAGSWYQEEIQVLITQWLDYLTVLDPRVDARFHSC